MASIRVPLGAGLPSPHPLITTEHQGRGGDRASAGTQGPGSDRGCRAQSPGLSRMAPSSPAGLRVPPLQPPSASAALSKNFTLSSEAVHTNLAPVLTDILPLVPTLLGRSQPFTPVSPSPVSPSLIPASPAASRPLQAVSLSPRGLLEQQAFLPSGLPGLSSCQKCLLSSGFLARTNRQPLLPPWDSHCRRGEGRG